MPGTFDLWITDRISFVTVPPASGDTGDFEKWITDRIYWREFAEAAAGVIEGSTTWGHDTGVVETNIRDFTGNWTGTGTIAGAGDAEILELDAGENMVSEVVDTGTITVELLQNFYDNTGDDVTLEYRHGATAAACLAAGFGAYVAPFVSLGFVQVRVTSTL